MPDSGSMSAHCSRNSGSFGTARVYRRSTGSAYWTSGSSCSAAGHGGEVAGRRALRKLAARQTSPICRSTATGAPTRVGEPRQQRRPVGGHAVVQPHQQPAARGAAARLGGAPQRAARPGRLGPQDRTLAAQRPASAASVAASAGASTARSRPPVRVVPVSVSFVPATASSFARSPPAAARRAARRRGAASRAGRGAVGRLHRRERRCDDQHGRRGRNETRGLWRGRRQASERGASVAPSDGGHRHAAVVRASGTHARRVPQRATQRASHLLSAGAAGSGRTRPSARRRMRRAGAPRRRRSSSR